MLKMPETDKDVMARRVEIAAALREIVPGEGVMLVTIHPPHLNRHSIRKETPIAHLQLPHSDPTHLRVYTPNPTTHKLHHNRIQPRVVRRPSLDCLTRFPPTLAT